MSSEGNADLVEPLTEREQEVLNLLAQGKTDRELANELVLSINTVKWHNRQIYGKLDVDNREQAAKRARRLGLLAGVQEPSLPDSNLTVRAGVLVGRKAELADLDERLTDPAVRIVTITGVGGVGKTRLALAAAARQLQQRPPLFGDGIYVLDLSSLDEPEQLPAAMATTMDVSLENPGANGRTVNRQVADYLRTRKVLLVLDNFEHLLSGAALLSELVQRTVHLQLLVTSRERLSLREEQVFPLRGFAGGNRGDAAAARNDPFVQLFLQHARRVRPDFELTAEALESLAELQELTDGLPLAIELAAAWVHVLPLAAIVAQVRQDFDFLQSDRGNAPARHRGIRAVFEASWRRLQPAQQLTFCRLSRFRGGFTRGAAQEVAGASVHDLAAFSAKSLLRYSAEHDRYQLHELLRQFANHKLQQKAEIRRETCDGHAVYYCNFLRQQEQTAHDKETGEPTDAGAHERGNVRRAWKWAVAQGQVSLVASALDGLCAYYNQRGYEDEVRELLRAAVEVIFASLQENENDVARRRLLIRLQTWRAHFARSIEEGTAALNSGEAHLAELRRQQIDVQPEEAFFALCQGKLELHVDPLGAGSHFERALSLYEEVDDALGQAKAITALGTVEWQLGNYGEAADLVRRGLDMHERMGSQSSMAKALARLGLVFKHQGRLAEAEQAHRESYALHQKLGDGFETAGVAGTLANTLCWAGDFDGAYTSAREGLQLAEQVGSRPLTAYLLDAQGYACTHLGRYEEARQHAERALKLARDVEARHVLGWSLTSLGKISLVSGDGSEAIGQLEEAAGVLAGFNKSTWMLPLAYQALALAQEGHMPAARKVLAQVLREGEQAQVPHVAVCALPASAFLSVAERHVVRGLSLYALAKRHPFVANSKWFEDVVGERVSASAASLPAEEVKAAQARGRELDIRETTNKLLREFDASSESSAP